MRGGEKVLERIARVFPKAPLYTLFHFPGSVSDELEAHPIRTSYLQHFPLLQKHYRSYLPLFPHAVGRLDFREFDLVVSTSHAVAKGAIVRPGAVHICYCHTPMRYIWDQEEVYFPNRRGAAARVRGHILARLRKWDTSTANRVDHYLANSSFVAERIQRYYGRDSTVLPPPVDTEFYSPREEDSADAGEERPYALVVSALAPYKRVDIAIEAATRAGIDLKIVGDGPERAILEGSGSDTIEFCGRVPEEELRSLYRGAACFLQPGVEDFGISSVEALACGTPVVALGRGGIRDIVSDGKHGLLVGSVETTTADPQGLAVAIDKVRNIGFNSLDLRKQAELFSAASFDDRFQSVLTTLKAVNPSSPTPSGGTL